MQRTRRGNGSVKVVQAKDQEPVPAEIIAQSIKKIGDAAEQMRNSGLNRKAILVLLSHASGVPRSTVETVFNAMLELKLTYLR